MKRCVVTDQAYAPMLLCWMKERIGPSGDFDASECRTVAHVQFNDDGSSEILCVVAFNRWTPFTCEGNIASDGTRRWFSRSFAFTVYHLAFNVFSRSRMNFTVSTDNAAAIRMHEQLGHHFECRLADAFGEGKDALIYGLTKRQWQQGRWSKPVAINKNRTEE